ncbi:MAG: zf-HC2 domain-containing protein [Candidatus Omnitrophica bacterium]|nr:zf-HC2 domain-containing protein [Candidatus Omnitrophota bacterium]
MKQDHSCMFNHELLAAYVTRNVTAAERVQVERHLAECPLCRAEVKILEQTWLSLDAWKEDVENARPRLNDLRIRLKAVKQKPTLRDIVRRRLETMAAPFRLLPASPALAVIITGFVAYAGWQFRGDAAPSSITDQPSVAANSEGAMASDQVVVETQAPSPEPNNLVTAWDSLVQNSNERSESDFLIRMATDGVNFNRLVNYPSKDVFPTYHDPAQIHPASMRMMRGEFVRLE